MGFLEQIYMKFVTLKVGGPHEVIFGRFLFLHGVSNMCANVFLPNSSRQVMHNRHLVIRGKEIPPKLGIICSVQGDFPDQPSNK